MSGPHRRVLPWLALVTVVVCLAVGARTTASQPGSASVRAVIVDTDMGLDDVRALFALFAADEFAVKALVTVEGSAALGCATDHAIAVLEAMNETEVPVFRGSAATGCSPPPWRDTANGLAGAVLPPPRWITAGTDAIASLHRLLEGGAADVHYLALGPLTNLAALAEKHPDALAKIAAIWIPVRRTPSGAIEAWNLTWDAASTRVVFARASRIVLVDVGGVDAGAAEGLPGSLHGDTPAIRWMRRLREAGKATGHHSFLHDELAVAALAQPGTLRLEDRRFRLSKLEGTAVTLEAAPAGPLQTAGLANPAGAMAWLHEHWEHGPHEHDHGHDHEHDHAGGHGSTVAPAELLRTFHGHLGPYVVLGYRMGRLALEQSGSEGHFDISAHVHCAGKPPQSCFVDGIQLGAGCTLGKRNIRVTFEEGPVRVEFTSRGGKRITIRLKPGIPGEVASLVERLGVEAAGRHFLALEPDRLFAVER